MSKFTKWCFCKFEMLKKICLFSSAIFGILTIFVIYFFTTLFQSISSQHQYATVEFKEPSSMTLRSFGRSSEKTIAKEEINILKKNLFKQFDCTDEEAATKKVILLWTLPWNSISMPMEYGHGYMKRSKHGYVINTDICGSCLVVVDQRFFSVSDAVIFHGDQINSEAMPPDELRKPNQIYVWWNQESIATYSQVRKHYMKFFNYTMTVRRSSDIYSPYSTFAGVVKMLWSKENGADMLENFARISNFISPNAKLKRKMFLETSTKSFATTFNQSFLEKQPTQLRDLFKNKTRLAGWIVSNCALMEGSRLRMKLYYKLKTAGLKIDQFGRCSGNRVPLSRWEPEFFNFMSNYKFYLAWENSIHCYDYMTEKLFLTSLYSGVVPVIFGPHRDDVAAALPPKSYIFVEDFPNVQKLVDYLHYLDKNATAYAEYLEWRTWVKYLDDKGNFRADNSPNKSDKTKLIESFLLHKTEIPSNASFCELCHRLNFGKHENKVIGNLVKWIKNERPECLNVNAANLGYLFDS